MKMMNDIMEYMKGLPRVTGKPLVEKDSAELLRSTLDKLTDVVRDLLSATQSAHRAKGALEKGHLLTPEGTKVIVDEALENLGSLLNSAGALTTQATSSWMVLSSRIPKKPKRKKTRAAIPKRPKGQDSKS